ncbi:glycosyltransferase [Halomonas sp. PR-M31]|uniref:glycosyltransferase n=1 Tax=Halomonas sp. PR-M31 TaxID=1471202 RepID=UPI0006521071|nr:glycosyltransferase [Halomonas sp. PR-M31]
MKKHSFVVVRYSVLTLSNAGNFIIGRDTSFEDYRRALFDEERLKLHDFLFEKVMLKSIVSQENFDLNDGFTLLVLTSNELPEFWFNRLENHVAAYPWIKIVTVDTKDSVEKALKSEIEKFDEEICYATIRLDDDDALSSDFLYNISAYIKPEFENYVVSFGAGYEAVFDNDSKKFTEFCELYYPKVSAGLTKIDIHTPGSRISPTIYGAGNHVKVDQVYPLILDSRRPSVFRSSYAHQDTSGAGYAKRSKNSKTVVKDEVLKYFDLKEVL